jgi:hypothetical protein
MSKKRPPRDPGLPGFFGEREGDILRDEGIKAVTDPYWQNDALNIIAGFRGWRGITEDYKPIIIEMIGQPRHQNCWGALAMAAKKQRLIIPTGGMETPEDSNSHSRKTQVYVSRLDSNGKPRGGKP